MKNQTIKIFAILSVAVLFFGCSDDPEVITWEGDITDELRTELLAGNNITIPGGTYYVSEAIIVEGYCGIVQGAADGSTIIEISKEKPFEAAFDPSINQSGTEVAEIFAIYNANCDVTFQNLTFNIEGAAPAAEHNNPFMGTKTSIDNVIVVGGGSEAAITVTYKNLIINGEPSSDAGAVSGRNLAWPLIVYGADGVDAKPVDAIIDNCMITNAGKYAVEYLNVSNSTGIITNNTIRNSDGALYIGWGLTDMNGTNVDIKNNEFLSITKPCLIKEGSPAICFMDNFEDGVAMADDCPQ